MQTKFSIFSFDLLIIIEEGNDYWALINMDIRVKLPPVLVKSEKLKITKPESIGEGNFGKIYQGELNTDGKSRVVAIKTLKGTNL